ncbi:hypothetical protein BS78_10G161400 [Paspalum vaginatum]|nr:hypothetical protein BS78_10G161400 [Paspalum vaginatum]
MILLDAQYLPVYIPQKLLLEVIQVMFNLIFSKGQTKPVSAFAIKSYMLSAEPGFCFFPFLCFQMNQLLKPTRSLVFLLGGVLVVMAALIAFGRRTTATAMFHNVT